MVIRKHKLTIILLLILLLTGTGAILDSWFGWLPGDDEVLQYVQSHYEADGSAITSGEYLASGFNANGEGYKSFLVSTEKGDTYLLKVNLEYRRHLNRIGPESRVLEIEIIPETA